MTGSEVPISWQGHRVHAHVPERLDRLDIDSLLTTPVRRACASAAAALAKADERLPVEFEPLLLLLMRAEGIASSDIEGIAAPTTEVAMAEIEPSWTGPAAQIASNLSAVRANRVDVDPIAQAAICHVQCESIHPYADGNGRLGRILIAWVLTRRLGLASPPPVSVRLAADSGRYLSALTLWRQGVTTPWLSWFADIAERAAFSVEVIAERVGQLTDEWEVKLAGVRADSVARRIVQLLPRSPVLRASTVASLTGVSSRAARDALTLLGELGIITPYQARHRTTGRPSQWWQAAELITLVSR